MGYTLLTQGGAKKLLVVKGVLFEAAVLKVSVAKLLFLKLPV